MKKIVILLGCTLLFSCYGREERMGKKADEDSMFVEAPVDTVQKYLYKDIAKAYHVMFWCVNTDSGGVQRVLFDTLRRQDVANAYFCTYCVTDKVYEEMLKRKQE